MCSIPGGEPESLENESDPEGAGPRARDALWILIISRLSGSPPGMLHIQFL